MGMLHFIEVHMGGEPVCINVRYIRDIYQCADDEKNAVLIYCDGEMNILDEPYEEVKELMGRFIERKE